MNLLQKSLKDYLSPKFLGLSFATLLIPLVILGGLVIFGGSEIFTILNQGAQSGNFDFVDANEYPFLVKVLQFAVVKWLIITLFYTVGGLFAVLLSLVIAMMVLGFLTPMVTAFIHKRYYKDIPIESIKSIKVFKMMGFTILKFVVLFLVCLPFVFIPFAINIPFFYLFYKFMVIDVGSNIMSENRLKKAEKREFSKLFFQTLGFFFLSIIPIIGIFLQLFFVIYFTHFFFQKELIPYKI